MKKIIILGCQEITVNIISFLKNKKNIHLSLVITYDLPLDKTYNYQDVANYCIKNKIRYINFKGFSVDLENEILKISPDFIFVSYFRKIIPFKILKKFDNVINLHPSYLPYYRGPVPTAWAILNNEKSTGFTIHKVDKGIDTGPILFRKKINIFRNETGYELYKRLMKEGFNLFKKNFNKIINKKFTLIKQKEFGSYFGKINVEHFIDWRNKKEDILNFIRVYSYPYSSAKTKLYNRTILIDKASNFKNFKNSKAQKPGIIIKVIKNKYPVISCADGLIKLEKYAFERSLNKIDKKIYLKAGNQLEN